MGRWRPPPARKSPYITAEGYAALQAESRRLWKRRAEVTRALSAAAAEGDRSENAEYIYRKKELRELDRRIRYLQKRLPELKIINTIPDDIEAVFFGAQVLLEDEQGEETALRIVGADEIAPDKAWISVDSPMARALLKKRTDEQFSVETPAGRRHYLILEVSYPTVQGGQN